MRPMTHQHRSAWPVPSAREPVRTASPQAYGKPGARCYAIGDVHGRADLLADILDHIDNHIEAGRREFAAVVLLGDLIDRGPCSREVIDLVLDRPRNGLRLLALKGNHEEMLLSVLAGEPGAALRWLDNGGAACARSYGVDPLWLQLLDSDAIAYTMERAIPARHRAFLQSLPDSARFGDYLLVHAGVRPGVDIKDQSPADLRWIRRDFLQSERPHGAVIVHGHSTSANIEERANRIGIDTGAYQSGLLTALWIDGPRKGYIQTRGKAVHSEEAMLATAK